MSNLTTLSEGFANKINSLETKIEKLSLTSAEFLALSTKNYDITDFPLPNVLLLPVFFYGTCIFGGIPYNPNGGNALLFYSSISIGVDSGIGQMGYFGFVDQLENWLSYGTLTAFNGGLARSKGSRLVIGNPGGANALAGNGSINFYVGYKEILL